MNSDSEAMRDDYSEVFAGQTGVRGQYFEAAMRAKRLVRIDEDILKAFPTTQELNAALRGLLEASRHVHLPTH